MLSLAKKLLNTVNWPGGLNPQWHCLCLLTMPCLYPSRCLAAKTAQHDRNCPIITFHASQPIRVSCSYWQTVIDLERDVVIESEPVHRLANHCPPYRSKCWCPWNWLRTVSYDFYTVCWLDSYFSWFIVMIAPFIWRDSCSFTSFCNLLAAEQVPKWLWIATSTSQFFSSHSSVFTFYSVIHSLTQSVSSASWLVESVTRWKTQQLYRCSLLAMPSCNWLGFCIPHYL